MAVNNEEYMEMQDLYQAEKRKNQSLTAENERLREALIKINKEASDSITPCDELPYIAMLSDQALSPNGES